MKRAKTLSEADIELALGSVEHSIIRESDRLKILLSCYAGLRAGEISRITVDAMLDANGNIADEITIYAYVAKLGHGRVIPMHPLIREAVAEFRQRFPGHSRVAVAQRVKEVSSNNVVVWFHALYERIGLEGCSSHSGRRTFITNLARSANLHGGSLKDVQKLAGHSCLNTTECYIESSNAMHDMIKALGSPPSKKPPRKQVRK